MTSSYHGCGPKPGHGRVDGLGWVGAAQGLAGVEASDGLDRRGRRVAGAQQGPQHRLGYTLQRLAWVRWWSHKGQPKVNDKAIRYLSS